MPETPIPKPLGIKAYGHIAHLPGSRMGPGDHHCHEGQARIACEKARDRHDSISVTEKVDGSCVSVARIDGVIVPLIRAGYLAAKSKYEQHHLFHDWAMAHQDWFLALLADGERVIGEWLAQAHATRYALPHEPFVAFDLMVGPKRLPWNELRARIARHGLALPMPRLIHEGGPMTIEAVREVLEPSGHGALDPVEGAVWRVERRGEYDFLAKWVRPDKQDGIYLPEISLQPEVWNWRPK